MKAIVTSLFAVVLSTGSFAATVQVGNCQAKLANYSTISEAVSNVPPGSTIAVCPGSYSEQVIITQPLTLKGVSSQGDSAAVIAVPSGAMVQTPRSGINDASVAQILVENPGGPVNISNLIVDGTGASNQNQNVALFVGIYYQDGSGVINNVAVRNENYQFGGGAGVIAENGVATQTAQSVTIENGVLSGMNGNPGYGVWVLDGGNGFSATIKSTIVDGAGASFGLYLQGSATAPITGTIASNVISGFTLGIDMGNSTLTATGNTIQNGIYVSGGGSTVKSNHIDGLGGIGVQLADAGTTVVEGNTIVNSSWAVIGCTASGATVTGNTILNANAGVVMASGNTATPNTINLTAAATQPCF